MLGTICFAIGISVLITPFYVLRYIYPVSAVAWVVLGVTVSRLKGSKAYAACLVIYMLMVFLPSYQTKFLKEKQANDNLEKTLAGTVDEIGSEDVIWVTSNTLPVIGYYYPEARRQRVKLSVLPELEKGTCYWLILEEELAPEVYRQFDEQGFSCRTFMEQGHLGTVPVTIYRIEEQEEQAVQ